MIVIRITGGLGNQMFQYSLYKVLKKKGKEVKADLSTFYQSKIHNGYELNKVFGIDVDIANYEDIYKYIDPKMDAVSRRNSYFYEENDYFLYHSWIFDTDNIFLDGYWQSEKYFKDIREEIIEDFTSNIKLDNKNIDMLQKIIDCNSVSLHIRRGDYINHPLLGGITTVEYYNNAINEIKKRVDNPRFIVFSNDTDWVKENLFIEDSEIVDWNTGEDSFKDMILMSKCKHNIIANSTFSWWGAWLNENEDKLVIAPNKWLNGYYTPDIWCEDWITVNID